MERFVLNDERNPAEEFLQGFVSRQIGSVERCPYQMRLVFGQNIEFIVSSPWRFLQAGHLQVGSGDGQGSDKEDILLSHLKGNRVISVSVSSSWQTNILLEKDYKLEVICDSVQYESWEAHLETGYAVFAAGEMTLFPPASIAVTSKPLPFQIYDAVGGAFVSKAIQARLAAMGDIAGLHSVGIAQPSQTKCRQRSHIRGAAFDIVELNGIPVSAYGKDKDLTDLLKDVQRVMAQRGGREVYGPAGVFKNGSEVLVPELLSLFTHYLHIALESEETRK